MEIDVQSANQLLQPPDERWAYRLHALRVVDHVSHRKAKKINQCRIVVGTVVWRRLVRWTRLRCWLHGGCD